MTKGEEEREGKRQEGKREVYIEKSAVIQETCRSHAFGLVRYRATDTAPAEPI